MKFAAQTLACVVVAPLVAAALSAQTSTPAPPVASPKTQQSDWDKAVKQAAAERASNAAQAAKRGFDWREVQPCTGGYVTPGWTSNEPNPCDHSSRSPKLSCHVGHATRADVKDAKHKGLAATVTVAVLRDGLSSKSEVGKKVRVRTEHAVDFTDGTPLPRGTELVGEVIDRNQPNAAHPIGGVSVRFTTAQLPGGITFPIRVMVRGGRGPADIDAKNFCSGFASYEDCLIHVEKSHDETYWSHHSTHMCAGLPGAAIVANQQISAAFVAPDKAVHVDQGSELTVVVTKLPPTP